MSIALEAVTCYGLVPNRSWGAQGLNQTSGLAPEPGRQVTSQRRRGPGRFVLRDFMYG